MIKKSYVPGYFFIKSNHAYGHSFGKLMREAYLLVARLGFFGVPPDRQIAYRSLEDETPVIEFES